MLLYLGEPIDRAATDGREDWKQRLQATLMSTFQGQFPIMFDPRAAWRLTGSPVERADAVRLVAVDLAVAAQADWLILYYRPDVESWGLPQELFVAKNEDTPVAVLWETDALTAPEAWGYLRRSVVLNSQLTPEHVFTNIPALAEFLRAQQLEEAEPEAGACCGG
jgi:hypothetical protein